MPEEDSTSGGLPETSDSGAASATQTAPVKRPRSPSRKPRQLPLYRVLLHNDEVNTFEHVIASILRITTLTPEEAVMRTLEADENGVSLLLITHLELAELYRDQFTSTGITVTIEPAEE